MEKWNNIIHDFIWGPYMLVAFLGVGYLFTLRTRVFQLSHFSLWMKVTLGSLFEKKKKNDDDKSITQFQSLCTALAATLGTGNIAGVATALVAGGPGAIFWMWVSAFLGMMTNFAEKTLGIMYRYRNSEGEWVGGPMVYMERGLSCKFLAVIFAVFCTIASFGMGNMTQANSLAEAVKVSTGISPLVSGIVVAILLACVILGGIGRIAKVTERLVPFMAIVYTIGAIIVIGANYENILPVLSTIFREAFNFDAAKGGVLGYGIKTAMKVGISKGIFSNEAGLGSSVIVHAASNVKEPVVQGMWGILEVFLDTIVMCTVTALVILTSGVFTTTGNLNGMALTNAAFASVLGKWGGTFICVAVVLFAFSTLVGWSFYGVKCVEYLFGLKAVPFYQGIYCGAAVIGCTMKLEVVWNLADNFNGLMAVPNLIAVALLSGKVVKELKRYLYIKQAVK